MRANQRTFAVVLALVVIVVASLEWQRHSAVLLREAIAGQRAEVGELGRLTTEHQRLVAAQVSPQELERRRAERSAVSALLGEIEGMKRRAESITRDNAARNATATQGKPDAPSLKGRPVASGLWKNAGQASPDAAFQTALWASSGGDLDSLVGVLVFDAGTQAKAEALFAQLPAAMRSQVGTPERLIALLTAKDVLPGSAQILAQYPSATGATIAARIFDPEGKPKQMLLSMRAEGDSWRLVVPGSAVEKYAAQLQGPNPVR